MKYSWLTCFALAGAALFIGGCELDFSKVDNPDYAAWKGFPVGSGFEFEGMQQSAAENPRRIRISGELLVFDKTQAIIKRKTQVFNPGGPGQLEFDDITIPARIKKIDNPLTQPDVQDFFRGWDSVLIGETVYDCEVHYYIVKHDAERFGVKTQGETGMKIWQCKKIPGGIAKIEMTGLSPDRLFMLSGQLVNVNIGSPAAYRPAQEYKPAAATTQSSTTMPDTENEPSLEKAITPPGHLPIMPQANRKIQTSGLNTSTSQPAEENESSPKVVLPETKPADSQTKAFEETPQKIEPVENPASRKPDPKLLSEVEEESATQPATEPSITPVKLTPKKLENDSEPVPGFTAPAGGNKTSK